MGNFLLTGEAIPAYSAAMSCEIPPREYRCPGEKYPISGAVHLGRLARFYPACRKCPHVDQVQGFSPRRLRRWAEVRARNASGPTFGVEGLSGTWHNELSPALVEQVARAFANHLRRSRHDARQPFALIVADDGRTLAAEALAAAVEGVRWTGCHAIEVGAASAPCVALAVDHWQAAGGLLVGNPAGKTNTAGLKFWVGSRPLSAGHGLEAIEHAAGAPVDRPTRSYGALRHVAADEPYLAGLGEYYHALRPLRVVLTGTCPPAEAYLRQLAARVACQVIPSEDATRLAHEVTQGSAHFGVAIDDDGERCQLSDEQGRPIPAQRLFVLLARHLLAGQPGGVIALEPDATEWLENSIGGLGGQAVRATPTRAGMEETMRRQGAIFGGGPSGRFWYPCGPAVPDALRTLTHLLVLMSRSDRRLSEVLDVDAPRD